MSSSFLPPPGPGAALPLAAPATAEALPIPALNGQASPLVGASRRKDGWGEIYAALDLGTNNCRLLVARANGVGFRVIDAFSRIVRLGEGVTANGVLSEVAILRTLDALKVCAGKIAYRGVTRARYVATEACRRAGNCESFLDRVRQATGIAIETITTEEEARLAVNGCAPLLDPTMPYAIVFDIGGGSTELVWLHLPADPARQRALNPNLTGYRCRRPSRPRPARAPRCRLRCRLRPRPCRLRC